MILDAGKIMAAEAVRSALLGCSLCSLRGGCRAPVAWTGIAPSQSGIAAIGEAPGREEDASGLSFQGQSGKNLDSCLAANYLDRTMVPVGNVVNCWPGPGNPDPTDDQIVACSGWFHAQISVMEPVAVLGLGRFASGALMTAFCGDTFTGSKDYGKAFAARFPHGPGWVIPTWHPSPHNRQRSRGYRLIRDAITLAATKVWEHHNGQSSGVGLDVPWGTWWESERMAAISNLERGCPVETIRAHWSAGIARTRNHPYLIRALAELAEASTHDNVAEALERSHLG